MATSNRITLADLSHSATESGLEVFAVLSLTHAQKALANELGHLGDWQQSGNAGEMHYMLRPPELLADITNLLPGARSLVCFSVSYNWEGSWEFRKEAPSGYGKVARYAWARDYHTVLKKRMRRFLNVVHGRLSGGSEIHWRAFSDAVPLLERALARASSMGFIGKNTLLIRPGYGSFSFLAEIIWDVEIAAERAPLAEPLAASGCSSCKRCIDSCPTGALRPYSLDSRRCISYLTIEKRGAFDEWERKALGDWLFGCDLCQDACPFNHRGVAEKAMQDFGSDRAAGRYLRLTELLSLRTASDFAARFAGTPLMRAGREQLLRNAACVAANTSCLGAFPALIDAARGDASQLVRASARSSLRELAAVADGAAKRSIETALEKSAV